MRPAWKTCCIEEWRSGIELLQPGDDFVWNDCGICLNPHVLGVRTKTWAVGIFSAKNEQGRWVGGADITFSNAGFGSGCLNTDPNSFPEEWGAQAAYLRRASLWVECYLNRGASSIPSGSGNEALRLISEALKIVEPKKVPVYTQLSLF